MAQQLADQRAAVLDSPRARDQWIETAGPAASRELGLIDGRVGQVHQPAGVGGVIGAGRDAGAVDAKAVDLDRPDRLADPLRDLEAGLRIRPGQEDPELFAPRRPARSLARGTCRSRLATARRTSSPRGCPQVSFSCLNRSRSRMTRAKLALPWAADSAAEVRASWKVR